MCSLRVCRVFKGREGVCCCFLELLCTGGRYFLPSCILWLSALSEMFSMLSALHALAAASVTPLHYDLVVVGGGSAGLTAAKFAARFKKSVLLVEKARRRHQAALRRTAPRRAALRRHAPRRAALRRVAPLTSLHAKHHTVQCRTPHPAHTPHLTPPKARMGGDCTWTGCVPSKTLLSIAKTAHSARTASHGISVGEVKVDMRAVKARIDSVIDKIYTADDSPEALQALGIQVLSSTF